MLLAFKSGAVENENVWEKDVGDVAIEGIETSRAAAVGNELLRALRNLMDDDTPAPPQWQP